jgi:multisubunit Na+/H+ antiporter MnhC subunit
MCIKCSIWFSLFLCGVVFFSLICLPLASSVAAPSALWSQTYGGAGEDCACSLVETSDGGYAIAGYYTALPYELGDFLLVRTNPVVIPAAEPFPTALVMTAFGVSLAVVAAGLLVYLKKHKRQNSPSSSISNNN